MIKLQTFDRESSNQLISWIKDEEALMQFAGPAYKYPLTLEQIDETLKEKNRYTFKIVEESTNKTIGHAQAVLDNNTVRLGRLLVGEPNLRGKGYGQLAVKALLQFAFNFSNVDHVELNVFDWNISAIKCYEKVGFERSSGQPEERTVNGKSWKIIKMEIKREKWEAEN